MQRFSSKLFTAASCAVLISALSACSTTDIKDQGSLIASGSAASGSAVEAADLKRRASELDARERSLAAKEARLAIIPASSNLQNGLQSNLTPPNAKPGQCFTKIIIPAKYRTVTERQVVAEAGQRIEVIPAKFKQGTKRVLVSEATEKLEVIPATYKTVTERVMVKPASKKLIQVPAQYETVSSRVLVSPARKEWKKGTGPIQRIDNDTGEIMCLVEVPASYKTVTKRVLKSPATTRTVETPAEYKSVTKRVVATAATTRTVSIPAKYKNISVTEQTTPPSQRVIEIPARYSNVSRQELVSGESVEWREILCDTNMTHGKITEIQRALKSAGYNPGPIDGNIGTETMSAVNAFQRSKGLPVDKYLNIATVRALRVK